MQQPDHNHLPANQRRLVLRCAHCDSLRWRGIVVRGVITASCACGHSWPCFQPLEEPTEKPPPGNT